MEKLINKINSIQSIYIGDKKIEMNSIILDELKDILESELKQKLKKVS